MPRTLKMGWLNRIVLRREGRCCYAKSMKKIKCGYSRCGKRFRPQRATAMFCCDLCRVLAWREKREAAKKEAEAKP